MTSVDWTDHPGPIVIAFSDDDDKTSDSASDEDDEVRASINSVEVTPKKKGSKRKIDDESLFRSDHCIAMPKVGIDVGYRCYACGIGTMLQRCLWPWCRSRGACQATQDCHVIGNSVRFTGEAKYTQKFIF